MREEVNFKFQMGTDFCCAWYHSSGDTMQNIPGIGSGALSSTVFCP